MMKIGTIRVAVRGYDEKLRQWALIDGAWAIHPSIDRGGYTITHAPSGGSVNKRGTKSEVCLALEEVKAWTWRGIPFSDIPTCEITSNYDDIYQEIRRKTVSDNLRRTVSELSLMNGCGELPAVHVNEEMEWI